MQPGRAPRVCTDAQTDSIGPAPRRALRRQKRALSTVLLVICALFSCRRPSSEKTPDLLLDIATAAGIPLLRSNNAERAPPPL